MLAWPNTNTAVAFFLHYLTDMFSSGHLRTPRRQIHNDSYNEQSIAATSAIISKEIPIWYFQANYVYISLASGHLHLPTSH